MPPNALTSVSSATTLTPETGAITLYQNDPLLQPLLSRLFVESVSGNASLSDAQVICISDIHTDEDEMFVRSEIVNAVMRQRNVTKATILFEISPIRQVDNQGNRLTPLVHYPLDIGGWDEQTADYLIGFSACRRSSSWYKRSSNVFNEINKVEKELQKAQIEESAASFKACPMVDYSYLFSGAQEAPKGKTNEDPTEYELAKKRCQELSNKLSSLRTLHNQLLDLCVCASSIVTEKAKLRNQPLYLHAHQAVAASPEAAPVFIKAGKAHLGYPDVPEGLGDLKYCIISIKQMNPECRQDGCAAYYGIQEDGEISPMERDPDPRSHFSPEELAVEERYYTLFPRTSSYESAEPESNSQHAEPTL